jgi:alkylated DNA repair protein (DNA oxidative demethylase)
MTAPRQLALFADAPVALPEGVTLFAGRIGIAESRAMLDEMKTVLAEAPPYRLRMKTGVSVINRMTNCGARGWHSDAHGYRYVDRHPETDAPWPAIPQPVARAAIAAARDCGGAFEPDACLVNLYDAGGRLNLHQDRDESDFAWPIVSLSFGADAVFALGGSARSDPVQTMTLRHGDVLVMHGPGRLRFHGVRTIRPGTAPFTHTAIPESGRLNLTLRRAR